MKLDGVDEVSRSNRPSVVDMLLPVVCQIVLETEYDNQPALSLYESLGFIREKRLYRFYLNGKDAFRLILTVPDSSSSDSGSFSSDSGISNHIPRQQAYRAIRISEDTDDEEDWDSMR